jgi:hypothetical protein
VDVCLVRGRRGGRLDCDGLPLGEYTADGLQRGVRLLVRTISTSFFKFSKSVAVSLPA